MTQIKIGIVGGTGYTGVELLRILARHPNAQLHAITSRTEAGSPVSDMFPSLRGAVNLKFSDPASGILNECDVVFFATPHGVAMAQAPALIAAGVRVVDLGADFRLQDTAVFEKWYKLAHTCTDTLKESAYGLTELNRERIKTARLVGNPGCYPTTMQLGLYPLLKNNLVDAGALIADCKSGVSGAGRKAEVSTLFSEAGDSMKAYGVHGHRHTPETVEQLSKMTNQTVDLIFTPHLIPMIRGMHSTIYAKLLPAAQAMTNEALQAVFEDAYENEQFVDVMPFGSHPETRSTRASNILRIALHRNGNTVIVLVVQDNLVKGAAGQAVQNMNVMFGLPETAGLEMLPVMP